MWQTLRELDPKDQSLLEIGYKWLAIGSTDRDSWPIVWLDMWQSQTYRPELIKFGKTFLETEFNQADNWVKIWSKLWEAKLGSQELENLGQYFIASSNASPTEKALIREIFDRE